MVWMKRKALDNIVRSEIDNEISKETKRSCVSTLRKDRTDRKRHTSFFCFVPADVENTKR